MEYFCHVWAGAPGCYLELLGKLQKQICRTVGPSLGASLEPLAHHWNVASWSLFYRYYFSGCSSELAQLVPFPYYWRRSICYSNRLHAFSVTIRTCYKDVHVNSFFPRTTRLYNSLPIEYFLWPKILVALSVEWQTSFNCRFFLNRLCGCFNLFVSASFSFNSMPWSGCLAMHGLNPDLKKLIAIIFNN